MIKEHQIVVFSDLDATLLDHHNYRFDAANEALAKLKKLNIPLVLNSSKTMPEMQSIRDQLGNQDPFIIENGAALVIPSGYFENENEVVVNFSSEYQSILRVLAHLKAEGFKFRHFDALTAQEVSELTSLSVEGAKMAKARVGSEPLVWDGDSESLSLFIKAVNENELKVIKGGRFYHVIGLFDKGRPIEYVLKFFEKKYANNKILSLGLGDSPNDLPMLEIVDLAIVVKSGRSSEMKLSNPNSIFTEETGPVGWNKAVLKLLKEKEM